MNYEDATQYAARGIEVRRLDHTGRTITLGNASGVDKDAEDWHCVYTEARARAHIDGTPASLVRAHPDLQHTEFP